jgi:hypothetical protein
MVNNGTREFESPSLAQQRDAAMISIIVMKKCAIAAIAALALTACTTLEKTATGTGVGAAVGAIAFQTPLGLVAGAVIGGVGTYLATTGGGNCQYRNSKGQIYTRRCHWL